MPLLQNDEFAVPQFLEREARLFGPLSFRQFVYFALMVIVLLFAFIFILPKNFLLFLFVSFLGVFFGGGNAFVRINNKTLPEYVFGIIAFSMGPKRYLWKKKALRFQSMELVPQRSQTTSEESKRVQPSLKAGSSLSSLSTKLEIGAKIE